MELSLSGFLFEDDYQSQSIGFPEFCALARGLGYHGIELRRTQVSLQTPSDRRREMLATARDCGLRITCLTTRGMPAGGEERDRFFRAYLDLCGDLECPLLKTGGDAQWLRWAIETAAGDGVTLAQNNHIGGAMETTAGTLKVFEEVDDERFRLLFDCLHLRAGGQDYVAAAAGLAARTASILVHSMRPVAGDEEATLEHDGRRWVWTLPEADGAQDWQAVFEAFRRRGYDGLVTVIESGWPPHEREAVARSCAVSIRRLWEAAA